MTTDYQRLTTSADGTLTAARNQYQDLVATQVRSAIEEQVRALKRALRSGQNVNAWIADYYRRFGSTLASRFVHLTNGIQQTFSVTPNWTTIANQHCKAMSDLFELLENVQPQDIDAALNSMSQCLSTRVALFSFSVFDDLSVFVEAA